MKQDHNGSDGGQVNNPGPGTGSVPSISRKLTFSLVLSITLISLLGLVTIYFYSTREGEKELNHLGDEQLSFLVGSLEVPLWNFDQDSIAVIARTFAQNEVVERVRITDGLGKVLVDLEKGKGHTGQVEKKGGIYYEGLLIGSVELHLTKNLYRKALKELLLWSGLGIFSFLMVLVVSTRLLVRRYLRQPLQALSAIAQSYGAGEYEKAGGKMPYEEFQEFEKVLGRMGQEIKQQVMQIREAEKRYRTIFENALEGIFQVSRDGSLIEVNPAFARIHGYDSPAEMLADENYATRTRYVDPGRRAELLRRLQKDSFVKDFEAQYYRKDGSTVWGSLEVRAIRNSNGEIIYTEGFMRDITQRKLVEAEKRHLESQLRQSQKMEAIGTLSGGVAHEFNNMLGIILGNVELALDDIPRDNPAFDFLSEIRKASLRGTEIVQQLLRFSRQKDQPLKPLDLGPLIKESLGFLRASIPTVIEFEVKMPEQCWPVTGDPTQIHQVMINLCTNSTHAMEGEGGVLTVSLENVQFEAPEVFFDQELPPGKYVCIKISDTGCGIDPSCLDRVFEPFFSTKDVDQGTGMGMAVVHGIMKGHQGGVRISSQVGVGTTVECCFPCSGEEPKISPEVISLLTGGTENILCVDDEEAIGRMTQKQLERLGYRVEMRGQPTEALALIEKYPDRFDLVITDLIMPKLKGDRLISRLKAINPGIKTILCSGFSEGMDAEKAARLQADAFLRKPVSREELALTVRRVLTLGKT